jgi:cytochrome c oxidase assembly factor CtaG/putative copper export protein
MVSTATLHATTAQRIAPLIALGAAGIGAAIVALIFGGGAAQPLLVDPGAIVRWGLPVTMLVLRISSGIALGALLLAAFALPSTHRAYESSMLLAGWSAAVWTTSSVFAGLLTFSAVYLEPVTLDDRYGDLLTIFFAQTEIGRAWLWSTVLAGTTTVMSIASRRYAPVFFTGVMAVAALWPLGELGHTAGTASHNQAVTSAYLHYVFVGFWIGGLVAFAWIYRHVRSNKDTLATTLERFSTIALVSVIVVSVSGVMNAWIRVGTLDNLATAYGTLLIAKTVVLAALIAWGAAYRLKIISSIRHGDPSHLSALSKVVATELAVMGVAIGIAVALARTETPVEEVPPSELSAPTPAEYLTGQPLPPPFSIARVFTEWELDLLWTLITGFGIFFYLAGVVRLAKRGDHWWVPKTISWISAMLILWFTTSSGLYVYGTVLFSIHMIEHMILSMGIPLLMVLATPVTLAARAIHARSDGSRGPREWILALTHSKYLAVIGHPLIAAPVFALSLIVFYYSPLFEWALEDHLGHVWMTFHFLLSGYLFALVLLDADPHPHRPAYPLRLVIVLATMAFHAFFGLGLILGEGLLAPEWFGAMGREWGLPPLEDQQQGGELAWGLGEFPTLILAILVTWSWSRGDDREQRRTDRQAERNEDQELRAYNEMLAQRAAADIKRRR